MDQDRKSESENQSSQSKPSGCRAHGSDTEGRMDSDAEGKTKRFCTKLKEKWDRLTDDDLALANSNRDRLLERISQTYGLSKDDADRQLAGLENDCGMRAGDTCRT